MIRRTILLVFTGLVVLFLTGCDDNPTGPTGPTGTFFGEGLPVGNAVVRAFITVDEAGNPTAHGIILPEESLLGLPDDVVSLFYPPLPQEARPVLPFDHYELRYWTDGHNPVPTLAIEHFELTPFTITQAERNAIGNATSADSARALKVPRSDEIPVGYAPIPNADEFYVEARYGTRYFEIADIIPVIDGDEIYSTALFYGYYDAKITFMEHSFTVPYLLLKRDETFSTFLPKKVHKAGYWHNNWSIEFDEGARQYVITLKNLEYRSP